MKRSAAAGGQQELFPAEVADIGEGAVPVPAAEEEQPTLFQRLDRRLGGRLRTLVLTCNRRRILSARRDRDDPSGLAVRLDASFEAASDEVLAAVAVWLRSTLPGLGRGATAERRAGKKIRAFIEAHRPPAVPPRPCQPLPAQPVGKTLDLRPVRDDLNERFFGGKLDVEITWSRRPGRGRRRSIRLGSYASESRRVRIHPALDEPDVPRYVVEAIVYHEMLHAALPPPRRVRGRRRIHTPEFRRREALFPQHEEAEAWIRLHLDELLQRG